MADDNAEMFNINVDIVMCIDVTGSMGPFLTKVKDDALNFHDKLSERLRVKNRIIEDLRIKVVGFRDLQDGEPFECSDWFEMPVDAEDYKAFVSNLRPVGGGDAPESGLDAIAFAMKQDWVKQGAKRRHIVMLWTDAPTKPVGVQTLVSDLPKDLPTLVSNWQDAQESIMDKSSKRLVVFAPEDESWAIIPELENANLINVNLGTGLDEMSMDVILDQLSNSI